MARKWLFWWLCGAACAACGGNTGERGPAPAPAAAGAGGALPVVSGGGGAPGAGTSGKAGEPAASNGAGVASDVEAGAAGMPAVAGPRPYRALQIASGRYHACALLEDHNVKCWGNNSYGQLGLGTNEGRGLDPAQMGDALPFVDLGTGRTAKAIAAGRYTTCALLDDDSAKCWGMNLFEARADSLGLIGDAPGEMGDALSPLPLGVGRTATALAVGYYLACIALDDESYYCGGTSDGASHTPAVAGTSLATLTGGRAVLGLYRDGSARSLTGHATELLATGVVALTGGEHAECLLLENEGLKCSGVYGVPTQLPAALPGASALGISQRGILCAIHQDGHVACWGESWDQPWVTTPEPELAESIVVPLSGPAVAISSGAYRFHCALLHDGSVECWSWIDEPVEGVGWNAAGSAQLEPVDLGTFGG